MLATISILARTALVGGGGGSACTQVDCEELTLTKGQELGE